MGHRRRSIALGQIVVQGVNGSISARRVVSRRTDIARNDTPEGWAAFYSSERWDADPQTRHGEIADHLRSRTRAEQRRPLVPS